MKTYRIRIRVTRARHIDVTADTVREARQQATAAEDRQWTKPRARRTITVQRTS